MDPVTIIIKAIKVKIALNRLSRLKENAVRVHMGLPPKTNWCEECYTGFMESLRTACCEIFTPCCTLQDLKPTIPNNCCKRIFYPGTYENDVLKNCLGFIFGIIITMILYLIVVFQLKFAPLTSSITCTVLGGIITIGLAFSQQTRLMVFLMIPQFFTSKGRAFLLMYAIILVMTHPVDNFNRNVLVMSESATCGQELAFNQTSELMEASFSPLSMVYKSVRLLLKALKEFAVIVKKAFMALQNAIMEIASAIGKILKWLKNIVNICNYKMGEPYRKCKNAFDTAYRRCKDALGIFGFICEIVTVVSFVCYVCKILDLLCLIVSMIKKLIIDKIVAPIKAVFRNIYMMFWFNVTMDYNYEFNMTQSKPYSQVRKDILNEVKERLSGYTNALSYMSTIMMLTIIFVFIRALVYRQKYLSNERFDNFYITYKVLAIDQRRKKMGKESLFPLKKKEKRKYIKSNSIWMIKREKRKLAKGIVILFLAACHASFYLMSDYGLWWMLKMLKHHLMLKTDKAVPPHLKMHVQGEGALADMYRALMSMFDPLASAGVELDTTPCLPDPYEPEWVIYEEIGILYGVCLFLIIFESYGLRLRHVVCGCYFPKREQERGVWLYNHVLKNRGGFLKFHRRSIRKQYATRCAEEKGSLRGKLAARSEFCRRLFKWMGYDLKSCLHCGREGKKSDMENYCHCMQKDCEAIYCYDCFDDLNNLCVCCMNPIDYGDISDMSEERDSSEDEEEYLKKKEEARKRREERERLRAEHTPSKLLKQIGFDYRKPDSEDEKSQRSTQSDNKLDGYQKKLSHFSSIDGKGSEHVINMVDEADNKLDIKASMDAISNRNVLSTGHVSGINMEGGVDARYVGGDLDKEESIDSIGSENEINIGDENTINRGGSNVIGLVDQVDVGNELDRKCSSDSIDSENVINMGDVDVIDMGDETVINMDDENVINMDDENVINMDDENDEVDSEYGSNNTEESLSVDNRDYYEDNIEEMDENVINMGDVDVIDMGDADVINMDDENGEVDSEYGSNNTEESLSVDNRDYYEDNIEEMDENVINMGDVDVIDMGDADVINMDDEIVIYTENEQHRVYKE